jgi:ribosomal protein S6
MPAMTNTITVDHIDKDPKVYEIGYHIVPIISDEDLGARVTAIRDAIERFGGVTIADEYPRRFELAYPMAKVAQNKRSTYAQSSFGWTKFEILPKAIPEIEKILAANDDILRFIVVETVRENTLVPKKILRERKPGDEPERKTEKEEEKPKLTEAELDKTIEDLVIT